MAEIINIEELENRYREYEEYRNIQREKFKQTAIKNIENYISSEKFYYIINQINSSLNHYTRTKKNDRYCTFEIEKNLAFYTGGNHGDEKTQQKKQLNILKTYIKQHGYMGLKKVEERTKYIIFELRWKNTRK